MYCDMALKKPAGLDMTGVTKPYFRSGYVFVVRQGSGLDDLNSLGDPRLKKLKIGVNMYTSDAENSPPAMALSRYGVVGNLKGYFTFFSDQERPEDIVKGVANKDVDLAIAGGPLAGYYAKQSAVPLKLTPLPAKDSLSDIPFQYNMGIAVRRRDKEFRDSLEGCSRANVPRSTPFSSSSTFRSFRSRRNTRRIFGRCGQEGGPELARSSIASRYK